jgi:hypothetical protein
MSVHVGESSRLRIRGSLVSRLRATPASPPEYGIMNTTIAPSGSPARNDVDACVLVGVRPLALGEDRDAPLGTELVEQLARTDRRRGRVRRE